METFFANMATVDDVYGWDGFYYSNNGVILPTFAETEITNQFSQKDLKLIVFSANTAIQDDKSISAIEKYVPKLDVYASQFVVPSLTTITHRFSVDKGLPSFFFFRMEWDSRETHYQFAEIGDQQIVRPQIQSLVVTIVGRENPFVSKLLEDELYYMCRKNCHKYCNFKYLWDYENALLLSLEDLGLMGEDHGYPNRKRLDLEFRVTWKAPIIGGLSDTMEQVGRKVQLRSVFVNENHYLRGDPSQTEFYEVF